VQELQKSFEIAASPYSRQRAHFRAQANVCPAEKLEDAREEMTTKGKVARQILRIRKPVLPALADTFPKTPHRVQKTVLAVALFGKFGLAKMLPVSER